MLIYFLPPVLAGLAAMICGSEFARRRSEIGRLAPVVTVVLPSLLMGVLAFTSRDAGVPTEQALDGAGIAAVATALPLAAYLAAGHYIRSAVAKAFLWLVSVPPLLYYLLVVLFIVAASTQCPPGASECPM